MRFAAAAFLLVLACTARAGELKLPPYVPPPQRKVQSDVVVVADIKNIRSRDLTQNSVSVNLRVYVVEVLKGSVDKEFSLSFLVFPNTLESNLRAAPAEGRYILFLQRKKVEDTAGEALVLFWPHPFAFLKATPENIAQVRSAPER